MNSKLVESLTQLPEQIDELAAIRQQIKYLQAQEKKLSERVKNTLLMSGINLVGGENHKASLTTYPRFSLLKDSNIKDVPQKYQRLALDTTLLKADFEAGKLTEEDFSAFAEVQDVVSLRLN